MPFDKQLIRPNLSEDICDFHYLKITATEVKSELITVNTISHKTVGPRAYFSIKRPLFVSLLRASVLTQ